MKLICGPMATVSHSAFRITVEKFGFVDEFFNEMINAGSLVTNGPFEKYYLDFSPDPKKLVWQLIGKNQDLISKAAKILVNFPGLGLDLNLGCSAPDIYKAGSGIAWMIRPVNECAKMIFEVRKIIDEFNKSENSKILGKKRFSVKFRLGDDDFTDKDFFSFTDMLVNEGVELLTLHPRTKKEKLTKPPRYDYCNELCLRYKKNGIPVYLNGNITDYESYKKAVNLCPCVDGVMISRASIQKPWIFSEISKKEKNDFENFFVNLKELSLNYIDLVEKYQPKEFWKTRLQRFFCYFCDNFKFANYAKTQFLNAKNNDDLRNRIEDFFQKCPEEILKKI